MLVLEKPKNIRPKRGRVTADRSRIFGDPRTGTACACLCRRCLSELCCRLCTFYSVRDLYISVNSLDRHCLCQVGSLPAVPHSLQANTLSSLQTPTLHYLSDLHANGRSLRCTHTCSVTLSSTTCTPKSSSKNSNPAFPLSSTLSPLCCFSSLCYHYRRHPPLAHPAATIPRPITPALPPQAS